MFCIIFLCVGLKLFFCKPKRLVDLVVWTRFLRYRRRASAHALRTLRSQTKVVRSRDWVKNMEGPVLMPIPYVNLKSFFCNFRHFLSFESTFDVARSHVFFSPSKSDPTMPPLRHYKLLLLYGGSHDAITFKLSAYFGAPFCVLKLVFLFISCFCASSLCINANSMHLLCMVVVSMLRVHLHHVVA